MTITAVLFCGRRYYVEHFAWRFGREPRISLYMSDGQWVGVVDRNRLTPIQPEASHRVR